MTDATPATAVRRYARLARQCQAGDRVPALSVAVHRSDRPLWTLQVGEPGVDAETQFRIGSITKTFTAVLVLQCRDDGLLDLDDPIGRHLSLPGRGELTVRRLLSHLGGLQREPFGDVWDTLRLPDARELVKDMARVEQVLPQARRYHYSNLGFALLGELVARLRRGGDWAEVLDERILRPLGLTSIAVEPTRAATGYLVDAYSDHAAAEPPIDMRALRPAAQLWGTAGDLARWAAFLADPQSVDPAGRVLAPATLDEMRWPATVTNADEWAGAFGLGLILTPQGNRVVHVGHDGAMPGFLAAAYGRRGGADRPAGLAAAALGSSGVAARVLDLPHALLKAAIEEDPADIAPWRPGEPAPAEYQSVLGRWFGEGFEHVFFWRDGALHARGAEDPAGRPPAVFAVVERDQLRTLSGREAGELLRLTRDPATGEVIKMNWATYRFTRRQETFRGEPASG